MGEGPGPSPMRCYQSIDQAIIVFIIFAYLVECVGANSDRSFECTPASVGPGEMLKILLSLFAGSQDIHRAGVPVDTFYVQDGGGLLGLDTADVLIL